MSSIKPLLKSYSISINCKNFVNFINEVARGPVSMTDAKCRKFLNVNIGIGNKGTVREEREW